MWKDALAFGKQLFNLSRQTQTNTDDIKELQREMQEVRAELRALAGQIQEIRLEMKHDRENAARDRRDAERAYENLALRLEVALLRSGHALPAAPQLPAVERE